MAPKAVDARKRFNRNHRFRGHGPLLQVHGPLRSFPFRLPAPDRFHHLYPPTAPILFDVEAKTLLRPTGYLSREPPPR